MNREEFDSLLVLLGPGRERAAERYEGIRRKLIRLFEWRGAEFPEELADETFNRVARRLHAGLEIKSPDPYGFFCGVAYKVYQEDMRDRVKKNSAIDSGEWQRRYAAAEEEEEDPRHECIRRCLDRLPPDQRQLLLDYHAGEDRIRSRQWLAESLGDSLNALRIKVHRVRRQLESCLASCLGTVGSEPR